MANLFVFVEATLVIIASAVASISAEPVPSPAAAAAPAVPSDADRALARDIFKELIEIDTAHTGGDTTRAAAAVAARLRKAGLPTTDVQVLGPTKTHGNLVARLHGTGAAPPLLLLAHLDVVDAKRSDWTVDPFRFLERDGYYYGRGTQDDKSLAALWVATVLRLHRERRPLDRDVILALTADEENGPDNGVRWLLAQHRPLIDAALCLTEGANGEMKDGRRLSLDVEPSEKSYLTFTFEVKNKGGHSSLPEPDNAIVRLGEALQKVHRYRFPVEITPVTRAYFQEMSKIEGGALAADLRAVAAGAHPDAAAADRLSRLPRFNARLRTTCVPTTIEGGHAENALPQNARATVNCRVLPGHDTAEVAEALTRAVDDTAVAITVLAPIDAGPPSPLSPDLIATIARAGAAVWPGVPVVPVMVAGATDGRFLRRAGIPTYGLTGLFIDVGDIRAHGQDERLPVASFYEAQDFLYRVVTALAGGGSAAAPDPSR
jgi:acetylornithine deacetylase/succinyl-diaminopimelate desuccinylase-like protein